jgi:purine catabolism regulator
VSAYPDLQIYWGISGASGENGEMYHQLCQSANLALRYCMNDKSSSRIFTYKDTKFQKVISELSSNKNIKKISEETLEPLIQNDKNSSMDLVGTLIEFIRNNGNTSLTARNLHLNRQSLLYRLKKIESLTGMSLSERKDLLLLELFTRIQFNY